MGKNDFLSPKAIANRQKSKGLSKLRWYCQMCEKQCRDENGFKCHKQSESHHRMMLQYGENAGKYNAAFSEMFEESFLKFLAFTYRNVRVSASVAYNAFIADKTHIHMNATRWYSLTEFVKYLGKEGKAEVDETPKGWFIKYEPKDEAEALRKSLKGKRERAEESEEARTDRLIEEQIERAAKAARVGPESGPSELRREEGSGAEPIKIGIKSRAVEPKALAQKTGALAFVDEAGGGGGSSIRGGAAGAGPSAGAGGGALAEIMRANERSKEAAARKLDHWIQPGIVVKVLAKSLKEAGYYKRKGVVTAVHKQYIGELEMLESGDVLKVDQNELETVIPQVGGAVRVLQGRHRGRKATLNAVDMDRFEAKLRIADGHFAGETITLPYEDFSKLA
mmetsp:Transcript_9036/g.29674  ORF Transcript_9036/g.29674 Transcript_9036/m.29674 type:complete len:394 (+) Transcript_9036:49-1230(+)